MSFLESLFMSKYPKYYDYLVLPKPGKSKVESRQPGSQRQVDKNLNITYKTWLLEHIPFLGIFSALLALKSLFAPLFGQCHVQISELLGSSGQFGNQVMNKSYF